MEEITLLKDFAIIMVVAGAVTLLFRKLRQPVILGYLLAGVVIGPYTLPVPPVTDVHNVSLLADLGLVLILFGIGLEFSWSKIREMGLSVLIIGGIEITTMIGLGYGLGRLLGWSQTDAIFLGAALHISSSAIIVKILRDAGKLNRVSSRLIVGILVVEDFAAVTLLAVLSGIAATGAADFGDIGLLVLRLIIFTVVSLVLGAIIVPRIISFTHRFHSNEALLITSLGLCFAMALFGKYLGLSVAIGAFLMGALVGDTEHHEEVIRVLTPVRQVFAAVFFVAIGMLINIAQVTDFIVPAIIVSGVFILGKIVSNTLATFISGHDGRTSLRVGMGMPQMGEFSLVIAKVGLSRGIILPYIYPVIALSVALTSLTTPYIMRSADSVASFLQRNSPALLKAYVSRLADWLEAVRFALSRDTEVAGRIRHSIKTIMVNLLIVVVLVGAGTFTLGFVDELAHLTGIRADVIGLLFGFLLLMLCLTPFVVIWQSVRTLVGEAVANVLGRRSSARKWTPETLGIVLRDSIMILLSVLVGIWFIPLVSGLVSIGSFALAIPVFLLALILYLVLRLGFGIHGQLERSFARTLMGEEHPSRSTRGKLGGMLRSMMARLVRRVKPGQSGSNTT